MLRLFKKKTFLIAASIILSVVLGFIITFKTLKTKNKYLVYYYDLPEEVRKKSVELELERIWHFIRKPKPDKELLKDIGAMQLDHSIQLGASWILNMQEESGRYNYWYDPVKDEFSSGWDDNFLRQAGTTYSLLNVYEITRDSSYLEKSIKSLEYLNHFLVHLDDSTSYYLFNKKAKLGGIALPMLAMLKIKEIEKDSSYDKLLVKLANMIFLLQDKYGTGQFKSTYIYQGDYEHEKTKKWESKIYPGEALLALAEMYKAFEKPIYKERFDWAVTFYSKKKYWGKKAFMPWTISALCEMAIYTGDTSYKSFALKITDKMLRQQNLDPADEVSGSFTGLPMVSSATSLEALGDVLHMSDVFHSDAFDHYAYHALLGYKWLLHLQIDEKDAVSYNSPHYALGGFPTAFFDQQIRIDNTQHAISALSKGLKYYFKIPLP